MSAALLLTAAAVAWNHDYDDALHGHKSRAERGEFSVVFSKKRQKMWDRSQTQKSYF